MLYLEPQTEEANGLEILGFGEEHSHLLGVHP